MKWLTKIFTTQRERDLLMFISELKEDKTKLENELLSIKERYFSLIDNGNINGKSLNKQKLTKKENILFNTWSNNKHLSMQQLANKTKYKMNSLKVMISKLKKKGFIIYFK